MKELFQRHKAALSMSTGALITTELSNNNSDPLVKVYSVLFIGALGTIIDFVNNKLLEAKERDRERNAEVHFRIEQAIYKLNAQHAKNVTPKN